MSELETKRPISEMEFRSLAGLCMRCGMARREDDSDLCSGCQYNDSTRAQQIGCWFIKKKERKSGSAA